MNITRWIGAALCCVFVTRTACAAPAPLHYVCPRAAHPPRVDGLLNDAAWQRAPWTSDFVDIEGDARPAPALRTRAKLLWDDTFLYIGAELEEPHVWATLTTHDAVIFNDPDFEVFIDPDGDNHDYYEFEINALNTGWDLRLPKPYRDDGHALNSWSIPGLRTAVKVNGTLNDARDRDRGWTVEIALPWRVLAQHARRFAPPREGDQWRINFSRVEWDVATTGRTYRKLARPEHNWVWSPQGVIDMHQPERWGYLQFARSPSARFIPDPSARARDFLMAVYHAEHAFHDRTQTWAATLEELALPAPPDTDALSLPALRITPWGFDASAVYRAHDGTLQRLHVTTDSRLWNEELRIGEGASNP